MDKFKLVSTITREVFDDMELDKKFNENPIELIKGYAPEFSDEECAAVAKDVADRLVMWGRNTGVASALE